MMPVNEYTGHMCVARDPATTSVELRIEDVTAASRVIRLSRDEARRLAALLLFEAGRLDGRRAGTRRVHVHERKTA